MFLAKFFPAHGITVFHPPALVVQFDDLLASQLLFVWDELMDPVLVRETLGRDTPFAPAALAGYTRRIERLDGEWVYSLVEQEGAVLAGFVLLGLSDEEFTRLDDRQQAPIHCLRHPCRVRVGNLERVASVHLATGSYLGE